MSNLIPALYTSVLVDNPVEIDDDASATLNRLAIQAKIDEVSVAGGGEVVLGVGTYYLNDNAGSNVCIVMKDNIRLIGQGQGATILKIATSETDPVSVMENNLTIDNAEIAYLQIDGNKSRVPSTEWGIIEHEGIDLKGPTSCWIHHCYIHDCGTDAIDLDTPIYCIVDSCRIENNGGCAVHGNGSDCIISNISSKGNSYYRLQGAGESVRAAAGAISFNGDRHIITNINSIEDERGVVLNSPTRCVISNCTILNHGSGSNITGTTEIDPITIQYDNIGGQHDAGSAPTGGGCGIYIFQGTQTTISNCNISSRDLTDSYSIMIAGISAARHQIVGCSMSSGRGLYINACDETNISSSTFANASGAQYNVIIADNAGEIIFNGCMTYGGAGGYRCFGNAGQVTSNVTFLGCSALNSTGDGFSAIGSGVTNMTVSGCISSNNTDGGVDLTNSGGQPTSCVIINNNLRNNGTALKDGGLTTTDAGNIIA